MEYVRVLFTLEVPDGLFEEAADKTVDAITDAAEAGGWTAVGATRPMWVVNEGTEDEELRCQCDTIPQARTTFASKATNNDLVVD